jgi:DDE superfamily endonuclease
VKDFVVDYLPPYSPELNPIERVWKLTRRQCLHNRYFPVLDVVVAAVETQFENSGTRAMIDILLLGRQYGYRLLKEALEKALDLTCFDVETVRLLLTTERFGKRESCQGVEIGALRAYDRPQPTPVSGVGRFAVGVNGEY